MLNLEFLSQKIAERFGKVEDFAGALGLSKQAVYKWLDKTSSPDDERLIDIFSVLDLSESETETLLCIPATQVFFRTRGLQTHDENVGTRSRELADTFFKLDGSSYVVKDSFVTVGSTDPSAIAAHIRGLLNTESEKPVTFTTLMSELKRHSINVFFLPFQRLGIVAAESGSREVAFTAKKGNRAIIFSDTTRSKDQATFDICHELVHLILGHTNPTKEEERLCNQVSTLLIYPPKFFELKPQAVDVFLDAKRFTTAEAAERFSQLCLEFDWSPMGLAIALKEHGLIRDAGFEFKRLMMFERNLSKHRKTIDDLFYFRFTPEAFESLVSFFDEDIQKNKEIFKPLIEIRDAAAFGRISSRRVGEILGIDSGDADELVRSWMSEKQAIASQDDDSGTAAL